MNYRTVSKKQKISGIIITLPFTCAVVLLCINLVFIDEIYLENNFRISIRVIAALIFIHLILFFTLKRFNMIEIGLPKYLLNKFISIFALFILLISMNLLLEMGLRMNFNYWLKSDNVQTLDLIVTDKYVSHGKVTDRYIIFNSCKGKLKNKVGRKKFESFTIGETYKASVNTGYFGRFGK